MTDAFSDRQPLTMSSEPGPDPAALLNNLLLKPVLDGLLQQQRAFSHGFHLVHTRMTASDDVADHYMDPIPPQTTTTATTTTNNNNGSPDSRVRAKRRASSTLAAAGWSPLRRGSSPGPDADAAAALKKERGFAGTRALAAPAGTAQSSVFGLGQAPVVVLSEKAKMLGAGARWGTNGEEVEELIVPVSSSSPSRKKAATGIGFGPDSGDVARETGASGPKPLILVHGFDQNDNKSQLGSGYNEHRANAGRDSAAAAPPPPTAVTRDVKQPPRQQQHRRSLGNNNSSSARRLLGAPPTVSFDEFGQWFLALNRDIAHRHQVQAMTYNTYQLQHTSLRSNPNGLTKL